MKTLTIIFATAVLLTSCTQTKEQYSCETQLTVQSEPVCICQLVAKKKSNSEYIQSKKGLTIRTLKSIN